MGEYYNAQEGIPRRRSASPERQTQTESAQPTRTRHTGDDDAYSSYPLKPLVRRLDNAPLTSASSERHYVISMSDGTEMRVTERKLATMPKEYRQAARLVTPAPPKRQGLPTPQPQEPQTDDLPRQPRRRRFPRFHWLVGVGVVMLIFVVGWIALTAFASWWQVTLDDWQYGRPRTFQADANVGHGTAQNPMSHFLALNLNGHIEIIEIAGNPADSRVYIGPDVIGSSQQLTPVTLIFKDVNGDGRVDMIVQVSGSQFIYLNTGTGFKPSPNQ